MNIPIIIYVVALFIALQLISLRYQKQVDRFFILRAFLIIGVFIHEFSHYIACKFMLAPVGEFKVGFRQGYVKHAKSRIPLLGGMIISLAPLFVGLVLLIILFLWLTGMSWQDFGLLLKEGQVNFKQILANIDVLTWKFWLILFLDFQLLAVFVPSKQDFKNIAVGLGIYLLLSYFTTWFNSLNGVIFYVLLFAVGLIIIFDLILEVLWQIKKFFMKRI